MGTGECLHRAGRGIETLRDRGCDVGLREVGALVQEWLVERFGEGVGEAVAEVEGSGVAAFAELPVCFASDVYLLNRDGLQGNPRLSEKILEGDPGNGVAAVADHDCSFEIRCYGNVLLPSALDGAQVFRSIRFVEQYCNDGRAVDHHQRGKPSSS
jgi:hypothetical protein